MDLDTATRRLLFLGAALTPFNYGVGVPLGDVTLHPLQLWTLALVMGTLVLRPRAIAVAVDAPVLLLWTSFAFVFVSTIAATPEEYRVRGFLDVILLAVNLAAFTLVYGHLRTEPGWWKPFAVVLYGASIVASGFLTARALTTAQTRDFDQPDSFILGLGTSVGTFTAALTAASVAGVAFAPTRRLRFLFWLGVPVHGLAAGLALARGPWLAASLAGGITLLLTVRYRPGLRALTGVLVRTAIALAAVAAVNVAAARYNRTIGEIVVTRVVAVADVTGGTGQARLVQFKAMLDDALDSPLFGHGASSYRQISELLQKQGSVSENFFLEMFHAGGALAALPLALVGMIIATRLIRSLRPPGPTGTAAVCLAGGLGLVLGALTNPAGWDTAFWVLNATAAGLRPLVLQPGVAQALELTPTSDEDVVREVT